MVGIKVVGRKVVAVNMVGINNKGDGYKGGGYKVPYFLTQNRGDRLINPSVNSSGSYS